MSAAIIIGGVGSIFWVFVSGVFAIATKYAETFLCMKYRKIKKEKNTKYTKYYGGTMYVLRDRIGNNILAFLFAIFVIIASFGIGCMIQSNSVAENLSQNLNIDRNLIAIIITIIASYIIFSNERKIAKISSIIVPISTIIYFIMSIILLYIFRNNIINSILIIIDNAFNFKSGSVGIFTFLAMKALSTGLSKGMFSNEAGMGSSPIFETTVNNTNIKQQSIISSTSVFIDTVVLCSLTGIIFVASNMYINETNPVILVQNVFETLPFGNYLLTFCLTSFGFSAIPCWGYYGSQAIRFIFNNKVVYQNIYKIIYTICVYIGAVSAIELVWTLSSIANAFMTLPNIYMIYYLLDEIEY
ncbi:MAG: alanine:cation symporter family protein [Clostridia bacterium]|nr:alanine:cation symporter family protein [Clostridia bacterium]MDD4386839.1 alanine:cation symporter family protein [Clostridia bacterium]